jgi:hypothetical protein
MRFADLKRGMTIKSLSKAKTSYEVMVLTNNQACLQSLESYPNGTLHVVSAYRELWNDMTPEGLIV